MVKVSRFGKALYSISFTDLSNGWIVGDKGKLLRTTNGGNDWLELVSGTTEDISSIFFVDSIGWIASKQGSIIKTTDGGENWTILISAQLGAVMSIHFFNSLIGWAAIWEGQILKTT